MADGNLDAPLDCLAIGAHADDVELFAGGTVALACRLGRRVGIVDLTRGEMATRGTPEGRAEEARSAAAILGIQVRETLDLGDGELANHNPNRRQLVEVIRRLRPRLILTHWREDRHPDHRRAHELARDAAFFSYVGEFPAAGERWEVEALAYFLGNTLEPEPRVDWVVDIGAAIETKRAATEAYKTQFFGDADEADDRKATYISSRDFWEYFDRRSRLWGHLIDADHGEPFMLDRPAHAGHPLVELVGVGRE